MSKARKVGALKKYVVGRSTDTSFADAFEKQEAIIRYLGGCDPTGEVGCIASTIPVYAFLIYCLCTEYISCYVSGILVSFSSYLCTFENLWEGKFGVLSLSSLPFIL